MPSLTPLVDAHQLGLGETGNETWARNVVGALETDGLQPPEYVVSARGRAELSVPASRVHIVSERSSVRLAWDLPRVLRAVRPAAVVCQYTLPPTRVPGVLYVHDLSFLRSEARAWIPARSLLRYRLTIGTSVRRARAVVVPTQFTREEVLRTYRLPEDRVLVAPLAVDRELRRMLDAASRSRRPGTFLAVGTVLPRKNLTVAAAAVAQLRAEGLDCRLRLVGPVRAAGARDLAAMQELLGPALEVVGPVPLDQLAREYAGAQALVFPSLFEGFGLPVLEAMAAGLPVVCSTATCLPEVAGDAALLVDPEEPAAWAAALREVVEQPARATALGETGRRRADLFTWSRAAAVLREAVALAAG